MKNKCPLENDCNKCVIKKDGHLCKSIRNNKYPKGGLFDQITFISKVFSILK